MPATLNYLRISVNEASYSKRALSQARGFRMILITGGNGFIGANVASRLLSENRDFRITSRRNVAGAIATGDIHADTDWSAALTGVSTVIHLAGMAHQISRQPDLQEFRKVNVEGSVNLARQAAIFGSRRFVFMSSIGVLGQTTKPGIPFNDASPVNPITPYAVSKLEAERALKSVCEEYGMELVIIRPPLVYGRGARGNLGRLVRLVSSDFPLPLASIKNRRSMVSIETLTDAICAIATYPKAVNETFVISDKSPVSTPDIVKAIANGLGKKPTIFPCPPWLIFKLIQFAGGYGAADGLVSSLEVDSTSIAAFLGWDPEEDTLKAIELQLAIS